MFGSRAAQHQRSVHYSDPFLEAIWAGDLSGIKKRWQKAYNADVLLIFM
jgi:hypothetical protein